MPIKHIYVYQYGEFYSFTRYEWLFQCHQAIRKGGQFRMHGAKRARAMPKTLRMDQTGDVYSMAKHIAVFSCTGWSIEDFKNCILELNSKEGVC